MFILGKLFWVTYRIVIPSFYLPLGHVFALVMASDLVASYYLALMFQVNHVVAPAIWPKVNKKTGTWFTFTPPNGFSPSGTAVAKACCLESQRHDRHGLGEAAGDDHDRLRPWLVAHHVPQRRAQPPSRAPPLPQHFAGTVTSPPLSSSLVSSSPALTKRVTQTHYPEIAPIVRKTCEEYEVPYVVLPSFWVALKAHLHYLMVMGAPDLH
jgi:hypothetical protein